MSKQILVSPNNITFARLPGSSGELSLQGQAVTDTILGEDYKSEITGAITWSITSNAIYKGFVGYQAKLLKTGTPVAVVGEPAGLVSGKLYRITDATRRIMDRSVTVTVLDGASNVTAQVLSIDYLFGEVTFLSTYTVLGAITLDYSYLPTAVLGRYTSYTLTQTADAIKDSDSPTLQSNGGFDTHIPGLRTVSISLPNIFSAADDWKTVLTARNELLIEINPDGLGAAGSVARGFFRLITESQSGDVGALEQETLNFSLNVPINTVNPAVARPFGWAHGVNSPIPTAIRTSLDAWQSGVPVFVKYLYDGVNGWRGAAIVTDVTLTGGNEAPNTFGGSFTGSNALTATP